MKDLKYLAAYSIPLSAFIGLYIGENFTYITPIYSFILLPIIELFTPETTENLDVNQKDSKLTKKLFDWMLYLNLPMVYGILAYAIFLSLTENSITKFIGIILTTGIVLVTNGINVAHELGHRPTWERYLGKILLIPSFYQHFYIEHNFGHHLKVGTPEDPATSKYNQTVYQFWFRSTLEQYISAWKTQLKLLKDEKKKFVSFKNDMMFYTITLITYVSIIYSSFGTAALILTLSAGTLSFLLLETINYIEHYGLVRVKKDNGRYERVTPIHSWNSNHTLGRIVLYELTRHSDHHHRSTKKYQILDHHDNSPQLPYGYPTSVPLTLVPPIWFHIMNKRVPREMIPN